MYWRIITLAAAAASLTGCTTLYPEMMGSAEVTADSAGHVTAITPLTLDDVVNAAVKLQYDYSRGYKTSAKLNDFSQLPIIAAAAAAGWILLDDKDGAATVAGKIGIGAGAYAASRNQFLSAGLPEIFIEGHGALTCVISKSYYFRGTVAMANRKMLDDALQHIANSMATVRAAKMRDLTSPSSDETTAYSTAKTLADQALTQAATAETGGLAQLASFDNSVTVFHVAVSAISERVASKGRVRPDLDFNTLRDSFSTPPKAPAAGSQNAAPAASNRVAIDDLHTDVSQLMDYTAAVIAASRPYSSYLNEVAACPDQVK